MRRTRAEGLAPVDETVVTTLTRLEHRQRLRWLRDRPHARTPALVKALSDEVTRLTRIRLAEAVDLCQTLAWVVERVRDAGARARAWRARGHVALHERRYRVALRCYTRSLDGFAHARQDLEGAITRSGALQTLIYLGRYREALTWASKARRIFIAHGDQLRLARLEANVGNILHRHDRFEEALARYTVALEAFERGGHTQDEAIVLRNMAVCYIGLNRFEPAMETADRARACAAREGLWALVAAVDYNVAYLHYLRGEYPRAIQLYDEARTRFEAVRDPYHAALCDLDHAELALELNLIDEGAALAASAHDRFRALGLVYERAKAKVNQGIAAQRRESWSDAARYYRGARDLFAREGNAVWTALLDVYMAFVLGEQGRAVEAERLGRSALRRFSRMPFDDRVALAHYVLARTAASQERLDVARRHCERALARLQHHPVPALAYRVWHLRGQVEERAHRSREALRAFERAHVHIESLRGHLGTDSLKIAFLIDKLKVYESLVQATLTGGLPKLERAYGFMEQAKSRTLVEQLSARDSAAADRSAEAETRRALAAAYRRRDSLSRGAPSDDAAHTERELRRLERRAGRSPHRSAGPELATALETLQSALPDGCRVLQYYVTAGRLLGWAISRRDASVRDLGPLAEVLRSLRYLQFQLALCRWHFKDRATDPRPALAHLRTLYDILVRPLAGHLEGGTHVVFVPHGPLHAVPFGALLDGDAFLGERVTTSVSPSGAVYLRTLSQPPSRHSKALVVGVADPRTPHIGEEVGLVSRTLHSPTILEGPAANKRAFGSVATHARLLHLATHGHFRSDNPDYSSIQLVDGLVTLKDLSSLELDADLVALSGCGTGRLVVAGGDEILGFTRGLLGAGARSLLVALWDISDAGASVFMSGFYPALAEGLSRGEASRAGARLVRDRYPHPYFWAPFVLVGDHRELPASGRVPIFSRSARHP